MGLKFKDIKDWKPTSISIVDKPGHPLAVFEVYEDDEEFIKKYSPISEVEKLTNQEKVDETVTMSSSFFEKLFGGLVSKADEPQADPPVKDEGKEDKLDKIIKRLDSFDERIKKLENPEAAPGAVQKSEGAAGDGGEGQGQGEGAEATPNPEGEEGKEGEGEGEEKPIVDDKTMVKKSKEVDPDLNKGTSAPTESFMKRIGRTEDGMKW